MNFNNKYRIETVRLPDYDYSQSGAYFITICTHEKISYFGTIFDKEVFLNEGGLIAKEKWLEIPVHFPQVLLDEFIIMPDHIHGIIIINKNIDNPVINYQSQSSKNLFQHIISGSIGSIIRGFKIGVTKWFRQNTDFYTIWQCNYYEHIIRNEQSLYKIRDYIRNNPSNWINEKDNNYTIE